MIHPTIQKLIDKLANYPEVKYSLGDDSLTVEPKDEKGFGVTLEVMGETMIIVSANIWHETFNKSEEDAAIDSFGFLLSDSCRLRLDYVGKESKRGTIETWESGNWKSGSTTALLHINIWSPRRTEYFQNDLIKTK